MYRDSKELEDMFEIFKPYLIEQPDGTYDFPPGTPQEIRNLREEYNRRSFAEQVASGLQ